MIARLLLTAVLLLTLVAGCLGRRTAETWFYRGSDEQNHYFYAKLAASSTYKTYKVFHVSKAALRLPSVERFLPLQMPAGTYYYSLDPDQAFKDLAGKPGFQVGQELPSPVFIPAPKRVITARHLETPAASGAPPVTIEVLVDTSPVDQAHPEIKVWAAHTAHVCRDWYGVICQAVAAGAEPPRTVTLVFVPHADAPAFYANGKIYFDTSHVLKNPSNYGMAVHELTHLPQQQKTLKLSWVVEGIADYTRWQLYESDPTQGGLHPGRSKYTDSYRTTAAFFDYLVRRYDPQIVRKFSVALRLPSTDEVTIRQLLANDADVPAERRKNLDVLFAEFMREAIAARATELSEVP
jgi:hypothetical protein